MQTLDRDAIASTVSLYAPRYSVRRACLFGSYARGDADASSDIDICIEGKDGFDLFSLGGFGKCLEDELGLSVDLVCGEDSFYPRARERYDRDKVLIYEES